MGRKEITTINPLPKDLREKLERQITKSDEDQRAAGILLLETLKKRKPLSLSQEESA